ncbi:fibronectin type III domain-containing protein [Candidatus Poriferisodalis sp.]|uniref:fibronectin type III domain-containing protein n=1 Tax=Candidatus Poriferisodalis sp. TaxID=3101277 RepID=UPI003B02047A
MARNRYSSIPHRRMRAAVLAALVATGVLIAAVAPANLASAAAPAAVTGLSVEPGAEIGSLYVSWDAHPGGPAAYRVSWAPDGDVFRTYTDTEWNAFPEENELTISGLEPGELYMVRVRARFTNNNGDWSWVETGAAATETTRKSTPPEKETSEGAGEDWSVEPEKESRPDEADEESSRIGPRDHEPEREYLLDEFDSIDCGNSACTRHRSYRVSLTAGRRYVAEAWGSSNARGGNAELLVITAVESPNKANLGSDYSAVGITLREPRVVFTASEIPGWHLVKVRIDAEKHPQGEPWTFRVVVYPYVPYEDCAASTKTTCTAAVGGETPGELEIASLSRSDEDWFEVGLVGGQLYEIVQRGDSTAHKALGNPWLQGVFDHRGRLLDSYGDVHPYPYFGSTQGTADGDSGPGNTALTYFTPRSSGTYYIGAGAGGGANSRHGHYVIEVHTHATDVLANDDCLPGMTAGAFSVYADIIFRYFYGQRLSLPNTQAHYDAANARLAGNDLAAHDQNCEIAVGQTVTGRIEHNGLLSGRFSGTVRVDGERDWFRAHLTAGTRYRVEVDTTNHGMHHPDLGPIYDADGVQVRGGNGGSGDGPYSERYYFTPTVDGDYYIEVAGPASSGPFNTGRYWLTLTEAP